MTEITGRFLVWGGALPFEDEIDDSQLDHLGYNPAISGLKPQFQTACISNGPGPGRTTGVTLDARSAAHSPVVTVARMRVENRSVPIYTYATDGDIGRLDRRPRRPRRRRGTLAARAPARRFTRATCSALSPSPRA